MACVRLARLRAVDPGTPARDRGEPSRPAGGLRCRHRAHLRRPRSRRQPRRQCAARRPRRGPGGGGAAVRRRRRRGRRGAGRRPCREALRRCRAVVCDRAHRRDRPRRGRDDRRQRCGPPVTGARSRRTRWRDHRRRCVQASRRWRPACADRPRFDRAAQLHVGVHRQAEGRRAVPSFGDRPGVAATPTVSAWVRTIAWRAADRSRGPGRSGMSSARCALAPPSACTTFDGTACMPSPRGSPGPGRASSPA